jgi:16S rRNA G527 N7-methylase RsmG
MENDQEVIGISKPEHKIDLLDKTEKKELHLPIIKKDEWFLPKQKDSLFWCVYIFKYGLDSYNIIQHSYGNKILEEKQKIIDFIQQNPKLLKSSNVKITNDNVKEILSEFMVDNVTSYHGLVALSMYYKMPIYLINDERKIYLKFLPEKEMSENKPCYLYLHQGIMKIPKYKLSMFEKETNLDSFLCLESHLKPLKPISYYKVEDLQNIMNKIGFIPKEKMKKNEYYEKLCELCTWNYEK